MPPILYNHPQQVCILSIGHSPTHSWHVGEPNQLTRTLVSKSKRHKKKKKGGEKVKTNGIAQRTNGTGKEGDSDHEEEEIEEPETPVEAEHPQDSTRPDRENGSSAISLNGVHEPNDSIVSPLMDVREIPVEPLRSPTSIRSRKSTIIKEDQIDSSDTSSTDDTRARLDALAREREALRDEVAQLRRSLEEIQGKHEKELGSVREQLEDTQGEKEHAEIQYRNLLGKVNTIKSQLGERLKADAVWPGRNLYRTKLTVN